MMSFKGRLVGVHRIAYELAHGLIPEGMCVMHTCDNPPCIKLDHLVLGTVADNNRDRDQKGRHVALRGSVNGSSKLEEAQVAAIKGQILRGDSTYAIADQYGVSQGTVWHIGAGNTWACVAPACENLPAPAAPKPRAVPVRLAAGQVIEMRERFAAGGTTVAEIAKAFGASHAQASSIIRGDSWQHVGGPTRKAMDPNAVLPTALRESCPHGHLLDGTTTSGGYRVRYCKTCARERMRRTREARRTALDGIAWPDSIGRLERAA